ncbi:unnamed protein product [Musa acuminata subsp. burmannicoides]
MMGLFVSRALILVLGYAYPAYLCYKTVELNKPGIEQLRFWCQYWIVVALMAILERFGDLFFSWFPMYCEAKLAFYIYLWYPKTRGTTYVYETYFRPYIAKHETDIDRNLLELRARAADFMSMYWQKATSYGQTSFVEILNHATLLIQAPRTRTFQQTQQPQQEPQLPSATPPAHQPAPSQPSPQETRAPPSPIKSQPQEESRKADASLQPAAASPDQPQEPVSLTENSETANPPSPSEEPMQVDTDNSESVKVSVPPPEQTAMEEAILVTRNRLRKRAAAAAADADAGPG